MNLGNIKIGSHIFKPSEKTYVMGILNVTPDSFSDGGCFNSLDLGIEQAQKMVADGADLIDIGGESTRPGSEKVSLQEELNRVIPIIEALQQNISVPISIDTNKREVAEKACNAGASLINDISGMTFDNTMIDFVAESQLPIVIMHTADNPKVMQQTFKYDNVVKDIYTYFEERIETCFKHGIKTDRIILDPGIGFGKSVQHNLDLINHLDQFLDLECNLLLGSSRKSFIGTILDLEVDDRLEGTLATISVSIMKGAGFVRVHDVKEAARVCKMTDAIIGKKPENKE